MCLTPAATGPRIGYEGVLRAGERYDGIVRFKLLFHSLKMLKLLGILKSHLQLIEFY